VGKKLRNEKTPYGTKKAVRKNPGRLKRKRAEQSVVKQRSQKRGLVGKRERHLRVVNAALTTQRWDGVKKAKSQKQRE